MNQMTVVAVLFAAIIGGAIGAGAMVVFQPANAPQNTAPPVSAEPTEDPRVDDLLQRIARLEERADAPAPDGTTGLRDEIADLRHQIDRLRTSGSPTGRPSPESAPEAPGTESTPGSPEFHHAVRDAVDAELQRRAALEQKRKEQARQEKRELERQKRREWLDGDRAKMIDRIDKFVTLHPEQREALEVLLQRRTDEYEALIQRAETAKQNGETDWTWWEQGTTELSEGTLADIRSQLDATQLQQLDQVIEEHGFGAVLGGK